MRMPTLDPHNFNIDGALNFVECARMNGCRLQEAIRRDECVKLHGT